MAPARAESPHRPGRPSPGVETRPVVFERLIDMPILQAEPDFFPPTLWDDESTDSIRPDARWWCLHTKPRQEKSLARELYQQRATFYLPQIAEELRTPRGRMILAHLPLFSSYLFIHGDDHARLAALQTRRIVNVLDVVDQKSLEHDLRQIHRMIRSGVRMKSHSSVGIGSKVRILSGPLEGIVGTVIRHGNRDQFVAVVNFLNQGAVVDLEDWQVERI